ncbi:MAG: putative oxidoreductase SadH [Frankiales bacterium]|nr:putative oxidoreductase SadH [Frankiales bacterium]
MREYLGRTAVITGAGSGIGRALALELAGRGARLAVSDVDEVAAKDTAEACRSRGASAHSWQLDVADRDAVFAHAGDVVEHFGAAHLLVNNAGVALHGAVAELTDADMRWVMEIDYWGVVHGSQAFLPHLAASGEGQLANVSSVFGLISVPKQAAYNAAKFAVRGFTEALRQEVRLDGLPVSVSCIHPGGVRTAIARSARVTASEDSDRTAAVFDQLARTSPAAAARSIVRGLRRDRARILVGPDAYVMAGLPRLLGARYGAVVAAAARGRV